MPKLKVAKIESSNFECCKSWKRVAKLPSCQIAKLQVAKLWTCDHGAKSLSLLFMFPSPKKYKLEFLGGRKNIISKS